MAQFNFQKLKQLFAALEADAPFAIAVSGGGDSMALLHLALNWQGGPHSIVALTVDHALREGSAVEARKVKRWCADLGVEHHTLKWRHEPIASGLQAKARAARYDLMTRWCAKHGAATLLTAHTAEDQAETVAMRSKRTQSPRSLAAIWPETHVGGIRILRPLLGETRASLRAYLVSQKQEWLEDPSNANEKFERVRVRNSAPALALARQAEAAQRTVMRAEAKAQSWCRKHLIIAPYGMMRFSPVAFRKLKGGVADAVLLRIIDLAGGTAAEAARRLALIVWLQAPHEASIQPRRTLGGALFAKRKREVIAAREPARIAAATMTLTAGKPLIWDGRFEVCGPRGSTVASASSHNALKSDDEIPAFVRAGWPIIMSGNRILATPLGSFHNSAKITFMKK